MSVELIRDLMDKSGVDNDELAKRMYLQPEELRQVLSGEKRFKRNHLACLDRASLSLALDRRDTNLIAPQFRWQILRVAMMVLQEQRPSDGENGAKDER